MLAADKALSTLPATAYILGGALSTYPISLLMKRLGRRAGFTLGAWLACSARRSALLPSARTASGCSAWGH